jgi:hypothetical protein
MSQCLLSEGVCCTATTWCYCFYVHTIAHATMHSVACTYVSTYMWVVTLQEWDGLVRLVFNRKNKTLRSVLNTRTVHELLQSNLATYCSLNSLVRAFVLLPLSLYRMPLRKQGLYVNHEHVITLNLSQQSQSYVVARCDIDPHIRSMLCRTHMQAHTCAHEPAFLKRNDVGRSCTCTLILW